ncbi:hypothetical protein FRC01_000319 [Tulasnella sp. 417]|nr:hypothetical protein FRC01_000319 [Tulasnella sp. 417]
MSNTTEGGACYPRELHSWQVTKRFENLKETRLPEIVFTGTDGSECESFVAAIQEFTFSKGWDEDHHWKLRFATSRLRGKALRWYAKLDPSIKKDWDLFVQALFDQYPAAEDPENDGKVTPDHTYPVRQYDTSKAGWQIGLLRVVRDDETGIPPYIWVEEEIRNYEKGNVYSYHKSITTNRHEALVVSFLPSSAPHQVGCLVRSIETRVQIFY